jgi:hypothetical protein
MKRRLSITSALLAVAGTGWFLVSERVPVSHEPISVAASSVMSQGRALMVDDAGSERLSTREASDMIQSRDLRSETARKASFSSQPLSTVRPPVAMGLSSPPVKNSPSPRPSPAVNQIRPTTALKNPTRSESSSATVHWKRARQESNAPQPTFPPVNREIVKPSEIPMEGIASTDSTGVPASDEVPEDRVVTVPHASQPAVWVDLGAASSLSQDKQDEIQGLAESLSRKITESGLDPASPEYKQLWDEAVVDSDQLFRQRYGNQAWMEHHVQAYHLAHPAGK